MPIFVYVELCSLFGVVQLFNNTLFCTIKIPVSPSFSTRRLTTAVIFLFEKVTIVQIHLIIFSKLQWYCLYVKTQCPSALAWLYIYINIYKGGENSYFYDAITLLHLKVTSFECFKYNNMWMSIYTYNIGGGGYSKRTKKFICR